MKIGKDWAAYASAAASLGGNKNAAKALETIHKINNKSGASKGAVYKDYFSEDNDYAV